MNYALQDFHRVLSEHRFAITRRTAHDDNAVFPKALQQLCDQLVPPD